MLRGLTERMKIDRTGECRIRIGILHWPLPGLPLALRHWDRCPFEQGLIERFVRRMTTLGDFDWVAVLKQSSRVSHIHR